MNRLVVLLGPTAVGKTSLSIALAQKLHSEIISGDSMLIYRGMDIGTAKPTLAERSGVPHHLMDILDPNEEYTVVDFQGQAAQWIDKLNKKGMIPILAGGTGLYIKALLENYEFHPTPGDEAYRSYLTKLAAEEGNMIVHERLKEIDPAAAKRLHPNDLRRVIRQLEIHRLKECGSIPVAPEENKKQVYDALVIGLTCERSLLYKRINQRVDLMIEAGLVAEVEALLAGGLSREAQAMQAIGYKEIVQYLDGMLPLDVAVQTIKKATRHFAKRQMTWYRKMPYIEWIDLTEAPDQDQIVEKIHQSIAQKFNLK